MSSGLGAEPVRTGDDARRVIVALCQSFYAKGWVSGTGGGISIRVGDKVFMAPSGLQKEMIRPEWIYELDLDGEVVSGPPAERGFTVSQCRPLFLSAMKERGAGAVIHTHGRNAVVAAALSTKTAAEGSTISLTRLEMLKGLTGVGFHDRHEVPVIQNTAHECDLADSLRAAMVQHPNAHSDVVQRHGMYVWGDDWLAAKRHAECYDELFALTIEFSRLGIAL